MNKVEVKFLSTPQLVADCGRWTSGHERSSKIVSDYILTKYIESEHSPIRALIMVVDLVDILAVPTSVHLVRHKTGVEHFVTTGRPDRTGHERSIDDRVNHRMILNYQALRNICKERLCTHASRETREAVMAIKNSVYLEAIPLFGMQIASALDNGLKPKCEIRGDLCHEFKCCGHRPWAFEEDSLP